MLKNFIQYTRRRFQAIIAIAICCLSAALIFSAVGSCISGTNSGAYKRPKPGQPNPPPPTDTSVAIRVRLSDHVETAEVGTTGAYRVLADGQTMSASHQALAPALLRRNGSQWWLGGKCVSGTTVSIVPIGESYVRNNGKTYRGSLTAKPADGMLLLNVDNQVYMESYLAGVLACELLRSWHQEAFNALAVAARTYATYEMDHNGRKRDFDVYDDQRSQVYGGIGAETVKSLTAVNVTQGMVLVVGPAGAERVFKTYYSSCCGGITNPATGLEPQGESTRALAGGVVCNDCAASTRYRWATVRIAKSDIFTALARTYPTIALFGGVRQVRVASTTNWGRPAMVEIIGPEGQDVQVRADDLRLSLIRSGLPGTATLYSMNCIPQDDGLYVNFTQGRGYGHGVGLCQYGIQGKALRGMAYYDILYSYFPGAKIMKAY